MSEMVEITVGIGVLSRLRDKVRLSRDAFYRVMRGERATPEEVAEVRRVWADMRQR